MIAVLWAGCGVGVAEAGCAVVVCASCANAGVPANAIAKAIGLAAAARREREEILIINTSPCSPAAGQTRFGKGAKTPLPAWRVSEVFGSETGWGAIHTYSGR